MKMKVTEKKLHRKQILVSVTYKLLDSYLVNWVKVCCKFLAANSIASDHSQSSMEEGMLILGSLMTSEIVQSRKYSLTHRFYSITT